MIDRSFLVANWRWLAAGFVLTLASSFGQTFFIALFGGELRAAFGLSHGAFGSLYTVATLASAATLVWLGALADHMRLKLLGVLTLLGLALGSIAMAGVGSPLALVGVLFGLRLFGQGMLTHVAMTAMARWFGQHRGRALSIAALGFPVGEGVLPLAAVALMVWIGWRQTWLVAAGMLLLVAIPILVWLLAREPAHDRPSAASDAEARTSKRQWTRAEVLRHPLFYVLMPGFLAPSFINTAVFFHQVHVTETKGWTLTWFAACYPAYALATVAASLVVGWAVDRWRAARLLPYYLVPLAIGLVALALIPAPAAVIVYMVLAGCTSACGATLLGALWAELYGTRNLGGIRALAVAGSVFASALGPGVVGWLIDWGVGIDRQLLTMAGYAIVCASLFQLLRPRLQAVTAV